MPLQIRKRDVGFSIVFKKNIALLSYQKKGLTKVVERLATNENAAEALKLGSLHTFCGKEGCQLAGLVALNAVTSPVDDENRSTTLAPQQLGNIGIVNHRRSASAQQCEGAFQ